MDRVEQFSDAMQWQLAICAGAATLFAIAPLPHCVGPQSQVLEIVVVAECHVLLVGEVHR